MTNPISVRSTTAAALPKRVIKPFNGQYADLGPPSHREFSTVGLRPVMQEVLALRPPDAAAFPANH